MSVREYKLDDPVYYFAYGSNMNRERMLQRKAYFTHAEPYSLTGFSLKFNKISSTHKGSGCANIVLDKGSTVQGVLYLISVEGLYNLDKFEGYPTHYNRIKLSFNLRGSQEMVKTYTAMPDKLKEGLKPTKAYLEHLLSAKDFLSQEYLEFLQNFGTFD